MMYRGPGYIYVCKRHLREDLPPTTDEGQCPYCKGGNLYGKYHKHRSGKKWWFNLQLEAAQKYVDQYPIEPYWDSYDGLCQEHVEMLLYGGEEGRMRVYDDLWEGAGEYTWAEGDAYNAGSHQGSGPWLRHRNDARLWDLPPDQY